MSQDTDPPAESAAADESPQRPGLLAPRKGEGMRLYNRRAFRVWGLAVVMVAFGIISLESLRSDLWIDEIITFQDFLMQDSSLGTVFRSYKDPNNHILFTVVQWCWVVAMKGDSSEELMRFPSLITGGLTILLMYAMGRRLLDRASGFFLAMVMAFSPVFMAFACQMRGYSMSIMFTAMATFGALLIARREVKTGLLLFLPAALLAPGVIPSNLLVTASLWVFMVICAKRAGVLGRMSGPLAACGIAVPLGMWVYLPIMDNFLKAMSSTTGWDSGWDVIGNWLTALLLHVGIFTLAAFGLGQAWGREHHDEKPEPADGDETRVLLPTLALCCAVPMILIALAKTPFPRSLLGFLPPLTVCAFYFFRQRYVERNIYFYLMGFFVLCNTLVGLRLGAYTTQQRLAAGEFPQSLVQQFYARNRDVSDTVAILRGMEGVSGQATIFTDYRTYFPLTIYWQFTSGTEDDSWQIECIEPGITQVPLSSSPVEYLTRSPQFVLAYSPELARDFYMTSIIDPASLGAPMPLEIEIEEIRIEGSPPSMSLRIFQIRPLLPDWNERPPRYSPDGRPREPRGDTPPVEPPPTESL